MELINILKKLELKNYLKFQLLHIINTIKTKHKTDSGAKTSSTKLNLPVIASLSKLIILLASLLTTTRKSLFCDKKKLRGCLPVKY